MKRKERQGLGGRLVTILTPESAEDVATIERLAASDPRTLEAVAS